MKLKIFCRCSLFPSWSGYGLISTPVIENVVFIFHRENLLRICVFNCLTVPSAVRGGRPTRRRRERRGNWMAKLFFLMNTWDHSKKERGVGGWGGVENWKDSSSGKSLLYEFDCFLDESCLRLPPDRICSGIVKMAPYKDSCLMVLPSAFRLGILFASCLWLVYQLHMIGRGLLLWWKIHNRTLLRQTRCSSV